MCLILAVWRMHPQYPCIIAANRDEYFERATEPAHWWLDQPQTLAGRDRVAGGTWLGITRRGRFAALTNHRGSKPKRTDAPSRGTLVTHVLNSTRPAADELSRLQQVGPAYNGFNLIFSDGRELAVYESESGARHTLAPGIYGLSNHLLDTPWPKLQRAKARLQAALLDMGEPSTVLELLRDDRPAPDEELPMTGISLEWERLLSSAFVRGPDYGTRCSTVIRIDGAGSVWFDEWTWDACGAQAGKRAFQFSVSREDSGAGRVIAPE